MHLALLIEDDPEFAELHRSLIELEGHTCEIAGSFDAAVELLGQHSFCYVLMDLTIPRSEGGMPNAELGYKLLERIRQTHAPGDLYVAVASAFAKSASDANRAHKLRCDSYLEKPLQNIGPELQDAVRHCRHRKPVAPVDVSTGALEAPHWKDCRLTLTGDKVVASTVRGRKAQVSPSDAVLLDLNQLLWGKDNGTDFNQTQDGRRRKHASRVRKFLKETFAVAEQADPVPSQGNGRYTCRVVLRDTGDAVGARTIHTRAPQTDLVCGACDELFAEWPCEECESSQAGHCRGCHFELTHGRLFGS